MLKRAYRSIGGPRRIDIPSVERPLKATITRKLLEDASTGTDETKRQARQKIKYLLEHPGAL